MDLTQRLLDGPPVDAGETADARWAASGAMALTGRSDGPPLLAPRALTGTIERLAERLARATAALGAEVRVDGPALLGERAALTGWGRRGRTSVGGATRLLRAADGWLALALARPSDVDLVPAWLGVEPPPDDPWDTVTPVVAARPTAPLVADGALLGLALAAVGECGDRRLALAASCATDARRRPPVGGLDGLVIADLSALWAGPLCADLLARAGATVRKVESLGRPDGARGGDAGFFALLNTGKESVVVDVATAAGRAALAELVAEADVVVESSRPRALEQLGIVARDVLGGPGRTRVWCSITGHGRAGEAAGRVGFGDDAAVAGGLVAVDDDGTPVFCADAAADASSGLVAAVATLDRLAAGGRWLVDVALARTAAHLAAGGSPVPSAGWDGPVAAPRARTARRAP